MLTRTLVVSQLTLVVSIFALIIAVVAVVFTYLALRETQSQLAILLRAPRIAMGLWSESRGALGYPMQISAVKRIREVKQYDFQIAVLNDGAVQADNCRLTILLKRGSKITFSDTAKAFGEVPSVLFGGIEVEAISDTIGEEWETVYVEARTIQASPHPFTIGQLAIYSYNIAPATTLVKFRLACDGGHYFTGEQEITFQ